MRYAEVCAGISAASVAWEPLGWEPIWYSEVEEFASAVLAHHHPKVPNLGDMRKIRKRILAREVEAPDLLIGGIPCQPFSLSGNRAGLDDERNLTQAYVELLDAIDAVRSADGKESCWGLVENVPGIFSDDGNAFGCLLAGLVGLDAPLVPPGRDGGWTSAGVVDGPSRRAAWRVLDAQYYGLAQRRERVFVLSRGGARGWSVADALLPIVPSLQWHPRPSRAPRKEAPRGVPPGARADRGQGSGDAGRPAGGGRGDLGRGGGEQLALGLGGDGSVSGPIGSTTGGQRTTDLDGVGGYVAEGPRAFSAGRLHGTARR